MQDNDQRIIKGHSLKLPVVGLIRVLEELLKGFDINFP